MITLVNHTSVFRGDLAAHMSLCYNNKSHRMNLTPDQGFLKMKDLLWLWFKLISEKGMFFVFRQLLVLLLWEEYWALNGCKGDFDDFSNKSQEQKSPLNQKEVLKLISIFMLSITNRPFYSCVLSCQAFDLEWGWRWPCCVRDQNLVSMITN